jgi:hypothetical protein
VEPAARALELNASYTRLEEALRTDEQVFEGATFADVARGPEKTAFYLRLGSAL